MSEHSLNPCGYRVVVRTKIEESSEGGIFIPDTAKPFQELITVEGELSQIGEHAWKDSFDGSPWAEVGETVIFKKTAGMLMNHRGEYDGVRLLNDDDIVAVKRDGQYVPCGKRVMVEPDKPKEQTRGKIILPEATRCRYQVMAVTGRLKAVAPFAWHEPVRGSNGKVEVKWMPWAEVGDRVLFSQYGGFLVEVEDGILRIMEDEDLAAVLDDDIEITLRR